MWRLGHDHAATDDDAMRWQAHPVVARLAGQLDGRFQTPRALSDDGGRPRRKRQDYKSAGDAEIEGRRRSRSANWWPLIQWGWILSANTAWVSAPSLCRRRCRTETKSTYNPDAVHDSHKRPL